LDVVIRAPEQIFIRGRGLDAELGGQIRIRGTTNNVIPAGQFSLLRGRLDILGKRLTLEEGAVTLEGSLDPFVRLAAEADAGDYDVFVIVVGPASEPQIQFRSEPELPEDEVVARLLFDRGIQNLSPLQAARMAGAVATLTGRGNGGLLGGLREGFELDDLDVTSDEDGNIGVRAGKYLSENVYSDVVVNSDGTTEIELNLDITSSFSATGSVDSEGATGIGIFFQRDY
jgi:translocation and assembly module TamB